MSANCSPTPFLAHSFSAVLIGHSLPHLNRLCHFGEGGIPKHFHEHKRISANFPFYCSPPPPQCCLTCSSGVSPSPSLWEVLEGCRGKGNGRKLAHGISLGTECHDSTHPRAVWPIRFGPMATLHSRILSGVSMLPPSTGLLGLGKLQQEDGLALHSGQNIFATEAVPFICSLRADFQTPSHSVALAL